MTCRTKTHKPLPRPIPGVRSALHRFARDEDGSLLVFGLVLFVLMIMLGGIAVDVMRYEQRRTALQQTADRSVLAAAALSQTLDPEEVVNDYFDKAGLRPHLSDVRVTEGINFRNVEATAEADLRTFFMNMIGIRDLPITTVAEAEQRIGNVEIVLVLDISGSMNSNNKATNMKNAAKDFVDTVLTNDAEGRISISVVPYNGQVNLGPTLRAKFNATHQNGAANVDCIDLPSSVYTTLTLSQTLAMPMTAHADTWTSTTQNTSWVAIQGHNSGYTNNWCPPLPDNIVRVMGSNINTLKSQIDAMDVIGATSINAGMRWGLMLIDPAMRPMVQEMVDAGQVASRFAGRPYDWTDEEAMKIIVLMTDGEHFAEDRVNTSYKSGDAPIWYSSSANAFMIQHTSGRPSSAGSNQYWYPSRGSNGAGEWRNNIVSGYTRQTWPQVWARARVSWVAWQLYARALGTSSSTRTSKYNAAMAAFRTQTPTSTMDDQLDAMCDMAKTRGVIIYGIAFEAPSHGEEVIEDCASTIAHYYDAQGLEISTAFNSIAANISQLRLMQ